MIIKVGATQIDLYDSIKELPVNRYQKFQEYSLIDSGIGTTILEVDAHFSKLDGYLVVKDIDSAIQERKNMHKNFFYMFLNANITSYSFCCLVKLVDGKPLELKEEEFDKLLDDLNSKKVSFGELEEAVEELKKKYMAR